MYPIKNASVADDNHTVLGSGDRYVQSSRVVQESDTRYLVRSHTGYDDIVLLSTLITVH